MAIETLAAVLRQINRLFAGGAVTGFSDAQLLERFVSGHDAPAFEALVARHGPMVLSVCRGILKDSNDAEDAFQATFLILVKKSGTFRGHVALGPWLYQVAHRVAIGANAAAARRRTCERRAGQMAAATSTSGPAVPDEQLQALHEEIARLPEKFRRAVILCDLERVPQDRAAGELRLSQRTLQRRLSEGRERLKARLIRRGLAQEGGMLGAVFLREARAAVPAAWGEATVRAALATVNQTSSKPSRARKG
ncbi:MAG: RNA polymerase sigma factor [Isosphaerales bacterium]